MIPRAIARLTVLALSILATPVVAAAQQPQGSPRIGVLSSSSPEREQGYLAAFQQSLRDLGYSEGKNLLIDRRYAAGKFDTLPALAAELVRLKVDILVVTDTEVRMLIVAGFDLGLRAVAEEVRSYGDRMRLVPCYVFDEADRCFTEESRILPNAVDRERFREFCLHAAEEYFPRLPTGHRLGFRDLGAITIFFDTVPNNSLPVLWYNRGRWFPLFPASGLVESS